MLGCHIKASGGGSVKRGSMKGNLKKGVSKLTADVEYEIFGVAKHGKKGLEGGPPLTRIPCTFQPV